MTLAMGGCGPPLTADALVAAEQRLGRPIPVSYRAFLLEHNGGRPYPDAFAVPRREGGDALECYLWFFLGVDTGRPYDDLVETHARIGAHIPPQLFPIAWDTFDDLICIETDGPDAGAVYFLEFNEATDGDHMSSGAMYKLASTLEGFLAGIYFSPPWGPSSNGP